MKPWLTLALILSGVTPALSQLTTDQKVVDFQTMAATYSKRYAPYEWKKQALQFDLLNIAPWLDKVKASKSDLEYFEVALQYVANLQDTHSQFQMNSNFAADLGLSVDIYDGKIVIEAINRAVLPSSKFPFQGGDELASLDGKSAEDWITELSRFRRWGNPQTTRRYAANAITFRLQSLYPRAVELGESAAVGIRRANGDLETYTLPWTKTGFPVTKVGPVPRLAGSAANTAKARVQSQSDDSVPEYLRPLLEWKNWAMPDDPSLTTGLLWDEDSGQMLPRKYVLGLGSRNPAFALPASFVQRLGKPGDFHMTGTYTAGNHKIGYIRVPSFSPPSTFAAVSEIAAEIAFMQQNTDGLVVDVMRNPGGGCYMLTLASFLIPTENFYFFGEYLRPTQNLLNSYKSTVDQLTALRADQWIIDIYTGYYEQIKQAYFENRGVTGSIPACSPSFENSPAKDNRGAVLAYTKPIITLIDEFSISAADIFPSMMQDNRRGLLVGMRTSGGGGSVSGYPLGYSEAVYTNTNTLVIRKNPIVTSDLPTAPFVENIGARPDVQLDFMTIENLLTRGRPFVDAFTQILVNQIEGR